MQHNRHDIRVASPVEPPARVSLTSRLEWEPSYRIGIASIDEQHRGLFLLYDDFVRAIERGCSLHIVDRIAGELVRYVDFHFRDEEETMARLGYDQLARHRALHDGLRHMVARLGRLPRERASLLVMAEFLRLWIRQHILVEDADLERFVAANEG